MTRIAYELDPDMSLAPPMGLVVLQVDETIEHEMRLYFADHPSPLYVTRIPSGAEVTRDTLSAMQQDLPQAVGLLPDTRRFSVVGYGCTSASSVIGSDRVEQLIRQSCDTWAVTNPLVAAAACASDLGISKFALLSPYVEEVNVPLRTAFCALGMSMDVFATFGESEEAKVARIATRSLVEAACALGADASVEGIFLSCTNLRTHAAIPEIQARIGKPVLSSNQSLAWHMRRLNAEICCKNQRLQSPADSFLVAKNK